ncbi:MAG: hypothetical protein LBU83_09215 [Bacteroidales bacterium]|jgi:hypothetical protein|nr:hypothetical protein [Bacteroidales bacterium]
MNKKFLSLMTAVLIVMAAFNFASCKKDSGSSDSGGTSDNPFVGTWNSDDYEDFILEVKETTWKLDANCVSGTYTYKGKEAKFTVTKVESCNEDGSEVGDEAIATINGNKLTLDDGDEVYVFTKKSGGGGGGGGGNEIFKEPCLDFGASMSKVKSFETRKKIDEDDDYLAYEGENSDVYMVEHEFDENELGCVSVSLNKTNNIDSRVMDFLNGKYTYLGDNGAGEPVFGNEKVKVIYCRYTFEGSGDFGLEYYEPDLDKSSLPTKRHNKSVLTSSK